MYKKTNLTVIVALVLLASYSSLLLGPSWDTFFHYELGKERLDYLFSFGANKLNNDQAVIKFYPGSYATIQAFLVQFFPTKNIVISIYLINLFFSIGILLGVSKVVRIFFNKFIGKITFIICFFNPIFFGHMSMSSMDILVAFCNIWLLYLIVKYIKNQNNKEKLNKYIFFIGLILGIGIGIRLTFIATVFPFLIFLIAEIFWLKTFIKKSFSFKKFLIDFLKILIIAYLVLILFWPHTHSNILFLPFKLAIDGLKFPFGVPYVLFNEKIFFTRELPNSYLLINLFYKMPEYIIISFIIFFILFFKVGKFFKNSIKNYYSKINFILLILIFPNIFIYLSPYSIYDGLRLFLYLIPFISIIPAILIFFLFKNIKIKFFKLLFLFLFSFKLFFLYNFFLLGPYQYVYLNIFSGKFSENYRKFENDYNAVSVKKLITSLKKNNEIFKKENVKIAVCGVPDSVLALYLKNYKSFKYEIVNKESNYDYIVMNNRAIWTIIDENSNLKKYTCYQKYSGKDVAVVIRKGLILSRISKNNSN